MPTTKFSDEYIALAQKEGITEEDLLNHWNLDREIKDFNDRLMNKYYDFSKHSKESNN
ncbi:MAG: hypothetical protein HRU12_11695 [Phaeodactylibacter sp.]|nr:hypothetical protein [Phaeodactylibacter sp.]